MNIFSVSQQNPRDPILQKLDQVLRNQEVIIQMMRKGGFAGDDEVEIVQDLVLAPLETVQQLEKLCVSLQDQQL